MNEKLKVVVIVGATSSGKTELSLRLAKKFNGVIISADSRQIYKHMDIATAKIKKSEQNNIPHYMLDVIEPDEDFTVSQYQKTVYNLLDSIAKSNFKKSKKIVPFIVGGTGLYVKAIIDGYSIPKVPPNKKLRDELNDLSLDELVKKLLKLDPNTQVDLKNKRRIIRAIEIATHLGNNRAETSRNHSKIPPCHPELDSGSIKIPGQARNDVLGNYEFLQIGLDVERDQLYKRIENKVDQMYKAGLIKETQKLLDMDYDINSPAMSALGYPQIYQYLKHKITLKKALYTMKQSTKKYAKRQLTWFKKDTRINWVKKYPEAEKLIKTFLNK